MKGFARLAALALLLAAAGAVCWGLGQAEQQVAVAENELATLQGANIVGRTGAGSRAASLVAMLPRVGSDLAEANKQTRAAASYWQARYDALVPAHDATGASVDRDPEQLSVAANAAYRALDTDGADRQTIVQQLDRLIKNYAEVLKNNPASDDAAYNYEYLIRLRDTTARGHGPVGSIKPDTTGSTGSHPTIHGHVGAPPKGVEMQKFKVMVPRRSDERKEGLEPGKGSAKERKG